MSGALRESYGFHTGFQLTRLCSVGSAQAKYGEGRRVRKLFAMAVAAAVVTALLPAAAEAKTRRVSTSVDLDVFGIIDRHGAVKYAWGAEVGAGLDRKSVVRERV